MKNQVLAISLRSKLSGHIRRHTVRSYKNRGTYTEPTVQYAQITDDEINRKIKTFLQAAAEFNKIHMAATAQKK